MKQELADIDQDEFRRLWYLLRNQTLANKYGVHIRTVRAWAAKMGLGPKPVTQTDDPAIAFPANASEDYNDAIGIECERVMVIGDSEIPDHDIEMFEYVLAMARKFGIKALIVNGDFVAMDSFSKWALAQVKRVFFKQEREAALISLQVFLQTFDNIYYIQGNHERRMPHATEGEITFGMFMEQLSGVEYSEYDHCDLVSGGREWFICHQKNFSIVPLAVPAKLCIARHKNIWCAHNHRLAWGYDPSGQYHLVEGGCCRDSLKTHYKQMRTTNHPMWNCGAGMIIDGIPYLFDKNNVNFWLSLKPPQITTELKKAAPKSTRKAKTT